MTTILIVAFGSRGDVDPYTGIGVRLQQAGFHVAVAACERYADLVRAAGLEYRWLPKDPQEGQRGEAAQSYIDGNSRKSRRNLVPEMVEGMRGVGPAIAEAAQDADLLLLSVVGSMLGYHVAEGLGIPSIGVHPLPTAATGDFSPVVLGTKSFGRFGNRAAYTLGAMTERIFLPQINELRTQLGLELTTLRAMQKARNTEWPILFGFSESVVPRPKDWHDGLQVTGYWWPAEPLEWQPDPALVDFLAAGPPPVFFGFGSTAAGMGERLSAIVSEALQQNGMRGVIQSGAAELHCAGDNVITVGDVPHSWLFPRMSTIVHHAGAGTTAAALRAGVPSVPVPVMIDQPFWAKRLVDLGVAPGAIPQKELDSAGLADALKRACDSSYRARAQELSATLAQEDGAGRVVAAVESLLASRQHEGATVDR